MKYFIDTEFLEGTQTKRLLGVSYGHTKPTIDLISIGIVSEDRREYYAISKDFNLWEAWNRFDLEYRIVDAGRDKKHVKVYWIRENVLRPIHNELASREGNLVHEGEDWFTYNSLKRLIKKYGKSNTEISEEIKHFIYYTGWEVDPPIHAHKVKEKGKIEFYAYFADYDWVAFCWLFGKMIDLPNGFPMYCIDLKQEMDRLGFTKEWKKENCPDPAGEHNALIDARWNKLLHDKMKSIR